MPSFDQTPDKPEAFGFKFLWFAVKAADPKSVLDALEIGGATPANWASGLAAANGRESSDAWVFVSPAVSGWVLSLVCHCRIPQSKLTMTSGKDLTCCFPV